MACTVVGYIRCTVFCTFAVMPMFTDRTETYTPSSLLESATQPPLRCEVTIKQSRIGCRTHLSVAERPDNGVDDQLQLRRRHREQRLEAVPRDGMQQVEELQPVLRIVLQADKETDSMSTEEWQASNPSAKHVSVLCITCCSLTNYPDGLGS